MSPLDFIGVSGEDSCFQNQVYPPTAAPVRKTPDSSGEATRVYPPSVWRVHHRGTEGTERKINLSSIGTSAVAEAMAGQVPIDENNLAVGG